MDLDLCIVAWNLKGLNNPARRNSIRLFLESFCISMICFQWSKLLVVNSTVVSQTFGPAFDEFDFIPANGTRGGIILAWESGLGFLRLILSHVAARLGGDFCGS